MLNDSKVLLGQNVIREKIRCYLELNNWDKETIARFNIGGGHCAGISAVWLYSRWVQTQPKTNLLQKISNKLTVLTPYDDYDDDYEWFRSTTELIANWDGERSLKSDESDKFERFASLSLNRQ